MGLIDDFLKKLKEAKPEDKNDFMKQLQNEKQLFEDMRKAIVSNNVGDGLFFAS